jgi:hypothetical protein
VFFQKINIFKKNLTNNSPKKKLFQNFQKKIPIFTIKSLIFICNFPFNRPQAPPHAPSVTRWSIRHGIETAVTLTPHSLEISAFFDQNGPQNTENRPQNTENGSQNTENGSEMPENGSEMAENGSKMPENGGFGREMAVLDEIPLHLIERLGLTRPIGEKYADGWWVFLAFLWLFFWLFYGFYGKFCVFLLFFWWKKKIVIFF